MRARNMQVGLEAAGSARVGEGINRVVICKKEGYLEGDSGGTCHACSWLIVTSRLRCCAGRGLDGYLGDGTMVRFGI